MLLITIIITFTINSFKNKNIYQNILKLLLTEMSVLIP